ncbi:20568_t:CDS:2, partial [Gigaspora margarita]
NPHPTQVFVNSQPSNPYLTRVNLLNELEILRSKIEAFRVENKKLKKENVKTLLFAQLLTSNQSWQELREAEELMNKKAKDLKEKKKRLL